MEEHLEEAGFLWTQWERSLDAADYTLAEVAAGDERRLLAHLDGLALGGAEVAEELLLPALEQERAETVAAAALALLCSRDPRHGDAVSAAREAAPVEGQRAWVLQRAMELASPLDDHTAIQDERAPRGAALADWQEDGLPETTRARDAALQQGTAQDLEGVLERCRALVEEGSPGCRVPLQLLGQWGGDAGQAILLEALQRPGMQQDALWALGFAGTVEAAEACLEVMDLHEDLALPATEAFCAITGHQQESPGVEGAQQWWLNNKERFGPGMRYIRGREPGAETMVEALLSAPMGRRHALGLELRVHTRGEHDLWTYAWAAFQARQIQRLARLDPQRGSAYAWGPGAVEEGRAT